MVQVSIRKTTVAERNRIIDLKLPMNWEQVVRQMLRDQQNGPDPETERREIRATLRLMRENFENRLYEGDEYLY
jgi:hypothetical protein